MRPHKDHRCFKKETSRDYLDRVQEFKTIKERFPNPATLSQKTGIKIDTIRRYYSGVGRVPTPDVMQQIKTALSEGI